MRKAKLKGTEKILLVRTDRIGDLILSLPLAEAIKQVYPHTRITFLVSPYARDVLENNPFVDGVICYEYKGLRSFFKFRKFLKDKRFDTAVLIHPTLPLALLLFLSRIRVRIGTAYRAYQIFFNYKVYQHRKTVEKHELEYNLEMLSPLGVSFKKVHPKIFLKESEKKWAESEFLNLGIRKEDVVVIVHPGSGNSSLNYPPEKYGKVADNIIGRLKAKIIITGEEKEKILEMRLNSQMKIKPLSLVGKTDLRKLAAVLNRADLLISSSTGPMHIARALGTPVVALFSPVFVASAKRWGPLGKESEVLLPPLGPCLKCRLKKCPHYDCMEKINEEAVFQKAAQVLKRKR